MGLSLEGKYQHAFGPQFVLGLGAKIDMDDTYGGLLKTHDYQFIDALRFTESNILYVAPGLALSDKGLVYLKLGSATRRLNIDTTSHGQNGTYTGVGLQYQMTPKIYVLAEFTKLDYERQNISINPTRFSKHLASNSESVTIGVGYKF